MAQSLVVSAQEMDYQMQCAARVREGFPGRTYHIVTYGCQMNAHDSENLAGMLEEMGFAPAAQEEADLVLFNTCCIRDNAERRLLGNVSALSQRKREKPDLLIGVCGCMMQQAGGAQRLLSLCPFVDLVFGTHNLYRLPELLLSALSGQKVREIGGDERGRIPEGLPVKRASAIQGSLTIMYGCNNFCTYCIVPYVRGRERSRRLADIVREAEEMASAGIQEILLLGQNVNSYDGGATFPELLRALDGVVPRIRFMTSHPKDLSDALIAEMARSRSVCPQFHLPVQSGSDKVLREMNRVYTRAHYLERVRALRQAVPDVGLTTDIIAGFPGETEADFQDTLSLVEEVQYDSAFTFIYSPRAGTRAAAREDFVPPDVQHERLDRLIALQETATARALRSQVGSVQQVLIEGASRRREGYLAGRTGRGMTVNFPGPSSLIGKLVFVRILGTGANTLRGEIAQGECSK